MTQRKRYGLWTLTFLVVGNMIGAGVFTTSGFTLESLRSPALVVLAWIVGGLIAIAGAISYGRLIRAMPESGGEYLFLSRAAHPLLGFIAGWVSLIAGFTGAIAFAATALESYARPAGAQLDWIPKDMIAIAVVVLSGLFHGIRAHLGSALQNAAVLLKLALLAGFLVLCLTHTGEDRWQGGPLADGPVGVWPAVTAFAGSLVWISLSYSGFNAAVYVASESGDPRVEVPKSLLRGTILVAVVYVLLNTVFVYAPPPATIAGKADVAAITAHWLGGERVANLMRAVIVIALLTSVSSMVMAAPRVYARMADDGLLPRILRFQAELPRAAIALQVALATLIILVTTLRDLLSYLGLTLSLSAACSVACLFLPSVRRRPLWHVAHVAPLLYLIGTLTSAALMSLNEPLQFVAAAATFSAGAIAYALVRAR